MPAQPPRILLPEIFQVVLIGLLAVRFMLRLIVQHLAHSPGNILHHAVDPVEGQDS
jgi:hypothetical protein